MQVLILVENEYLKRVFSEKPKYISLSLLNNNFLDQEIMCLKRAGYKEFIVTSFENLLRDPNGVFTTSALVIRDTFEYVLEKELNPSLIKTKYDSSMGNLRYEQIVFSLSRIFPQASFDESFAQLDIYARKVFAENILKNSKEDVNRPKTLTAKNEREAIDISRELLKESKILIAKSNAGIRGQEIFIVTSSNCKYLIESVIDKKYFPIVIQEFFHKEIKGKIISYPKVRVHVGVYSWKPLKYEIFTHKYTSQIKDITKNSFENKKFYAKDLFRVENNIYKELDRPNSPFERTCLEKLLALEVKKVLNSIRDKFKKENTFTNNLSNLLGFDFLILGEGKNIEVKFIEFNTGPAIFCIEDKELKENSIKNMKTYFGKVKLLSNKRQAYLRKDEKPENLYWIRKARDHLKARQETKLEKIEEAYLLLQRAIENGSLLALEAINILFCQIVGTADTGVWVERFYRHLLNRKEENNMRISIKKYLENNVIPFDYDCFFKKDAILINKTKMVYCDFLQDGKKRGNKDVLKYLVLYYLNLNAYGVFEFIKDPKLELKRDILELYRNLSYEFRSNLLETMELAMIFSHLKSLDTSNLILIALRSYLLTDEMDSPILLEAIHHLESHASQKIRSSDLLDLYDKYIDFLLRKGNIFSLHKALYYFLEIKKNKKDIETLKELCGIYACLSKKWEDGDSDCQDKDISLYYLNQFIEAKSLISQNKSLKLCTDM